MEKKKVGAVLTLAGVRGVQAGRSVSAIGGGEIAEAESRGATGGDGASGGAAEEGAKREEGAELIIIIEILKTCE